MILTEQQWSELAAHLESTVANGCPVCGNMHLNLGHVVFEMRAFAFGKVDPGGPILPLATVECSGCGYTMLFNAVSLGLVPMNEGGETPDGE